MKKIFFLITILILLLQTFFSTAFAENEPIRVMSLNYDNNSSLVCILTKTSEYGSRIDLPPKVVRLTNPNRIYFDINNSILIGEKQQLVFENSDIKEIRLAQFGTNPNIVRTVITFAEDFNTENINLSVLNNNIFIKTKNLKLNNKYFNPIYKESKVDKTFSDIVVNSQVHKKVEIPVTAGNQTSEHVMSDIQKAFEKATLPESDGKFYDSVISVDISSVLKFRTKYYISQYASKSGGILVSGIGQLTELKPFYLSSPKRVVIDLPNTFIDRKIRNREINVCPDGSCKDTAKIGQFEKGTARIVINSDEPEKYMPIFAQDSQSMVIINSDKLNHTTLSQIASNMENTYIKNINKNTSEMILSFTSPVICSAIRDNEKLSLYLFNIRSYNEENLNKTIDKTQFKNIKVGLLPQIGIKVILNDLSKEDIIDIEQGVDSKALKITYVRNKKDECYITKKRGVTKNKVVLDPGHGGSDYGAIREGINEKDITTDVTNRVAAILRSKGYKVALTRSEDKYVSLEDRVAISENEEPEIFVSIHVNAAVSTTPSGIETHYYHEYSKELAEVVHKNLIKQIDTKDRGLFKSMFYVINHTTDPAILVEIGFLSNENERNELITNSRKQKTAQAIADGIIEYLKKKK